LGHDGNAADVVHLSVTEVAEQTQSDARLT
jgi:hypothetical protein